jgi:caspase domain-containing protein
MNRIFTALAAAVSALIVLAFSAGTTLAQSPKRVALVIGNGAYQNVPKLTNPHKDATAISNMFKKAGFDWVQMRQDVGNLDFKRALREFMDAATDADIAVVYYAGHGIQVRDMNYMIPTDAKLATEIDAEDEAVSLDRIVTALEPAKRLRLVILDACRDNPFQRNMKRRVTMRAAPSGGLAKMEPTLGDTLIAYAAKAGSTAEDGDGAANSPFAAALLKHLSEPGLDIRLAFGRVRDEVLKLTANKQEPFVYGSLGGSNIALVPAPAGPKAAPLADVKGDYELVERIGSKKAWEVFLNTHKTGLYADLARAQLAKLQAAEGQTTASDSSGGPKMQLAAIEPARPPAPPAPSNEERRAWDRLKDSGDRTAIRKFIERYPSSVLREPAQTRLDTLDRAAQERDEQARVEREAAREREEHARAERELAKQREEETRLAKLAEAQRQRAEREAAAQREAAAKREREEAERREKEEAERLKAEQEGNRKRLAALEAERRKAERDAAAQRAADEKREREAAARREKEEAERLKAERELEQKRLAVLEGERKRQDSSCARDEERMARLQGSISQGWARADLQRLEENTPCERVRSAITALLSQPVDEQRSLTPAPAPTPQPAAADTPELVRSAQIELRRLGCFSGREDGALNGSTREAIERFLALRGQSSRDVRVTASFVADLRDLDSRVCPLTCARGQHAEGDRCVADTKSEPEQKKPVAKQRERDREESRREREASRPKPERRQPERAASRPAPQPQQPARSQAAAPAPRISTGGGGAMIGVGF